ncbi:MAG: ABC transporter permease [Gammaproteobacteria bacterium]|nr:ABC transporter permease [Gammaproteobacteria bacterium]
MHPVTIVFGKEIRDATRDKRALLVAFGFPVLAPVLVYFMMTAIIELKMDAEKITIPIVGAQNAPAFIQWLEEQDVRLEEFSGDAEQAVRDKEQDLVVIIPGNYQRRLNELRTISIEIVSDGSRTASQPTVGRVHNLIRDYNREIASLRLIARGVSPEVMRVVISQTVDVATKQQRTATALNFIPLYIIMAAFVSGMGLAVDSTAGERERKTLESLIINPVERYQIITGKWLAATIFASLGMTLTLLLCIAAMSQVSLDEIGLKFHVTTPQIFLMLIATLPLAFLVTSMQLLLGIFAKSFKDAQSYIGLLTLLPVLSLVYTMFSPIRTEEWMFAIPMLGQHLLLVDVLGAKDVPLIGYFYSAISCLVLGMALVLVTARLFQRESILSN